MKMKYLFSSLLSFLICISAFAQNNRGIDYFSLGEIKLAKEVFEKSVNQTPDESYYYLGEIALKAGNTAEARSNYEKGVASNPEATYSAIGLAKLSLKSNPKELEKALKEIQKKNKKNVPVLLEIAKAYFESGVNEEGEKALSEARKADKKSPLIYIFEGDMLAKQGKAGDAAAQYDQAINFDPNCVLAYIKGAKVYESINPNTATSMLKKALEINPSYAIANKYLAELSYHTGFYSQAIDSYKAYFAGGDYTIDDLTRYAASLYFTNDYATSLTAIKEGLAKEPNHRVLNRLLMYTNNKLQNYDEALVAGEKFFGLPLGNDTIKFLVEDYTTYADVLKEKGELDRAITEYQKAIELDPSKIAIYKDIASSLSREGKPEEAGDLYQKYIDIKGEEAESADYLQMGSYFYRASSAVAKAANEGDEAAKATLNTNVAKADAAFAKVIELVPESYQGYYWRANANTLLDQDLTKGLANPYYEKMIEVILSDGGEQTKQLIEGYRYLAIYNLYQFDANKKAENKTQAKEYAEKVLELDPEDGTAKQIVEYVNQ